MKKSIISLAAILTLSTININTAQANQKLNPWTECGIGAMIFPSVPAGAVISNVIWDLGTTAVTSNLISPETCEGGEVHVVQFMKQTHKAIEEETAIGEGEHLTTVLNMLGCDSKSHKNIIQNVRNDYSKVIDSTEESNRAETLYNVITTNASVCGIAS